MDFGLHQRLQGHLDNSAIFWLTCVCHQNVESAVWPVGLMCDEGRWTRRCGISHCVSMLSYGAASGRVKDASGS